MTATATAAPVFTYVPTCTYATDPATLVGVKVGNLIRVQKHYARPERHVDEVAAVTRVEHDEYGYYLGFDWEDDNAGVTWHDQASTITDHITLIDATPIAVGDVVTYHGTLTEAHGQYRVTAIGDARGYGYELVPAYGAGYALEYVGRQHITRA